MKKIVNLSLIIICLLLSFNSINALNSNNLNGTEKVVDFEKNVQYDLNATHLAQIAGRSEIISTRALICDDTKCETEKIEISGITTYYQNGGQPWSNTLLNGCVSQPYTIGEAGCAITSFAMIASKYGSTDNPGQVNTKMGSSACNFNHSLAASLYGLTLNPLAVNGSTISSNYTTMRGSLVLGKPLMVTLGKPGGGYHFVILKSFIKYSDGSYNFGIKDPTYNKFTWLSQYMNANYTIVNLRQYYK